MKNKTLLKAFDRIHKLILSFVDWLLRRSFDTPISNFFKGLLMFGLFIIFIHVAMFIVSIPAVVLFLTMYKGSSFIYELFPKQLLHNEFYSLEIGLFSFILFAYLLVLIISILIIVWNFLFKKNYKFKLFSKETGQDLFSLSYAFAGLFIIINLNLFVLVAIVFFLYGLFF